MSDLSIAIPTLICFYLHEILFLSSHFQSKFVFSSKESLVGSNWWVLFFIQSMTICLLIGIFIPLIFKVIVDRYVLSVILLLVFLVVFNFSLFFFFLLLAFSLVVWWFSLVVCLCSLYFCVYCRFLTCGYYGIHICLSITIFTCSKLI